MKKLFSLLLALCLLMGTAYAERRVFDDAGLFTPEEVMVMEDLIEHIRRCYEKDAVVWTTADNPKTDDDKDIRDIADNYYDSNEFGMGDDNAGLLLMLDMTNRCIHISTAGSAIDIMTDARINDTLDIAIAYMKDGYGTSILATLHQICIYFQLGIPEGAYRYSVE